MAFKEFIYVHAWDFFYKWTPTGSLELPNGWPDADFTDNADTGLGRVEQCFYNFGAAIPNAMSTRNTGSIGDSGSGALPWGTMASDMLWNCLTPTQSSREVTQSYDPGRGSYTNITKYNFTYSSASFAFDHGNPLQNETGGTGPAVYPITSSWKAIDPLMTASNMQYVVQGANDTNNLFPATIQQNGFGDKPYAGPATRAESIPAFMEFGSNATNIDASFAPGTNPDMITYGVKATGSFDGRYYDLAGGIGISRKAVSASLVDFNQWGGSSTSGYRESASIALKQRRLFFPTVEATASLELGTEWIGSIASNYTGTSGLNTKLIFDTNGAIFNVKFNLKTNSLADMEPDSGVGSELLIYIFNVKPRINTPSNRMLPATSAGYYPPESNIIRVKNLNPVMSFINPATGFLMESFNINVVQYGAPAQLVFEASGSLTDDNYFGCVIDDVSFCQVGVSTDPELLKPETAGGTIFLEIEGDR